MYYNHAAWLAHSRPHLHSLADSLLEELGEEDVQAALQSTHGASAVRLIPKPTGFRPIVNLGRRIVSTALSRLTRQKAPGAPRPQSANEALRGLHEILTFEKNRHRAELGACLFGTNEIFTPVQALKRELIDEHGRM